MFEENSIKIALIKINYREITQEMAGSFYGQNVEI
jgi:hypothetical protein